MYIIGLLMLISLWPIQGEAIHIRKMGALEGLSNNNVISIAQDREGLLWFATKDGLNRFDGNRFQIFRNMENNPNSLSSNVLNCVYADKFEDVVWVGTEKHGLNKYNYKTLQFSRFLHNPSDPNSLSGNGITHISSDSIGNLWIATYNAGVNYFNKQTQQFTRFNTSNVEGLVSNLNWYLWPDGDLLYVGHVQHGFSIIDTKKRVARNFRHQPGDPLSLPDNTVTCIFKDSNHYIWIGMRNGLTRFDPKRNQMIHFKHDPQNPYSLNSNFIKSIVETKDGELWLGTEGGGISILTLNALAATSDPQQIRFKHIEESQSSDGLSNASVQDLIQDSFGHFWAGGFIGGINFIQTKNNFFSTITFNPWERSPISLSYNTALDIAIDTNDHIWVANGPGGMVMFDQNKILREFTHVPGHSRSLNIYTVTVDHNNHVWFGTTDGRVFFLNTTTQAFQSVASYPFTNTPVYQIYVDSQHRLWICSDHGLYLYNPQTREGMTFTNANSSINDNNLRVVLEDSHGNFWIGSLGGSLQVYDRDFNLLHDFSGNFNFYSVNHIYMDSKNRVWVASQNDLFLFVDYTPENVLRIGKNKGLKENNIVAVIEGETPNILWISTINGISFLNVETNTIRNYNLSDEIAMGDYLKTSVAKTSQGTVYFGSQNGITFFDQRPVVRPRLNIKPVISSLLVAEKSHTQSRGLTYFPMGEQMNLKHHQNTFQINFNIPDFSLSKIAEFKYQLEGLDHSWYFIDKDKQVIFRNLPPGKYTFKLNARLKNCEWAEGYTSLQIVISPPWWLSWPAKLSYTILAALLILVVIRFYKKRLELESSLAVKTEIHQQELNLNEERLRFYTNIAHELRTPMTLVIGPLEDIISDKTVHPALARKLNTIHSVSNRLLNLINQMLEFRKSETKNRVLTVKKGNITSLIKEVGYRYKELHHKKGVGLNLTFPEKPVELFFDDEVITIILDNLISNAFKCTLQGSITIELKETNEQNIDYVDIIISDTGVGIPPEELPLIFNRYYQVKNKLALSGTGIGLALVRNMIELHEAEINVSSELNKGTTFVVRLLANNSYPNARHATEYVTMEAQALDESNPKQLILVVDDNPEITEYIVECLSDTYEVITANDGKMGIDIALSRIPDAVISDVMMPLVDGLALCKTLKKNVLTSHVPVILLTAKTGSQNKTEGYDAGADSYITKPFSGNLLKSRLKNILQTRSKLNSTYNLYLNKKSILNESANELDKEFVEKLTIFIEKNADNELLNVGMIAQKMNMSHSSLYRKVKALTDLTINDFVKKVRIQLAEQLLLSNKYTITEVMYQIGMSNAGYFRQCFKDEFGVIPSEYLQRLKE